mmetsp:Transcript_90945/g.199204  ORF Transcript_90945/g.199204 Transcript_90945/m.199204 type:complete len:200 (-) Transcript_90945:944-1543(-)
MGVAAAMLALLQRLLLVKTQQSLLLLSPRLLFLPLSLLLLLALQLALSLSLALLLQLQLPLALPLGLQATRGTARGQAGPSCQARSGTLLLAGLATEALPTNGGCTSFQRGCPGFRFVGTSCVDAKAPHLVHDDKALAADVNAMQMPQLQPCIRDVEMAVAGGSVPAVQPITEEDSKLDEHTALVLKAKEAHTNNFLFD